MAATVSGRVVMCQLKAHVGKEEAVQMMGTGPRAPGCVGAQHCTANKCIGAELRGSMHIGQKEAAGSGGQRGCTITEALQATGLCGYID